MTRRTLLKLGLSALATPMQAATGPQRREFVAPHMGTLWRLVFFEDDEAKAKTARDAAWARLEELNARLSDYRDDSELSRLSRERRLERPSADLRRLLVASRRIAEETDGAFDITVGPVVKLWREARRTKRLPDRAALAEAVARVDWRAVVVHEDFAEITKPGVSLDLGSIAKGYAQDEVLTLLREQHGLGAALIDAGGGVVVSGPPPDAPGWQAGLASLPISAATAAEDEPAEADAPPTVWLAHASVSTAGDANQHVEIDGRRYSHIVDPKTGLGLTRPIQASVIASSGLWSDGYDTAFCVMGEDRTRAFFQQRRATSPDATAAPTDPPWLCVRLISRNDEGRTRVWESKGFARFTRPKAKNAE